MRSKVTYVHSRSEEKDAAKPPQFRRSVFLQDPNSQYLPEHVPLSGAHGLASSPRIRGRRYRLIKQPLSDISGVPLLKSDQEPEAVIACSWPDIVSEDHDSWGLKALDRWKNNYGKGRSQTWSYCLFVDTNRLNVFLRGSEECRVSCHTLLGN